MHPQAAAAAGEREGPYPVLPRQGGGVMALTFSLSLASLATVEPWNTNKWSEWMDLHEEYPVWDKPSSVHPQCIPLVPAALTWSVAPPTSVLVHCSLFSNPTPVIFVWPIILSGPDLPAWKPENLAPLEQSLVKHWSEPYQWLDTAGFTIFKRKMLATKARNAPLPVSWPPDVEHPCLWRLPCTTVLFSPQAVTGGQFHRAPSTPSVRALWLPSLWKLLQSRRLPGVSFVLGPMLSTG